MNNKFLNSKFSKREKRIRKTYEIEDDLYNFLEEASLTYDASVSDILNFCIAELIRTNDLKIYTSPNMKNPLHNFNIAVSNVKGLAKLSETTPFTIKSLVNMSIKNIIYLLLYYNIILKIVAIIIKNYYKLITILL